MRTRFPTVTICFVAMLAFAFAFTFDAYAGEKRELKKVGIVLKLSDEFQNGIIEGAEAAAKELGLQVIATAPDAATEAARQVEMIEDMITADVDVLLFAPILLESSREPLDRAYSKGIQMVFVDFADHEAYPKMLCAIGTGNYRAAQTIAEYFVSILDDPKNAKVTIVRGMLGDENHNQRTQGFTNVLEKAGVQILDVQAAQNSADNAATLVENWIQRYGTDGLTGIMSTADVMSLGVMSALMSAGVHQKVITQGFDGDEAIIKAVNSGDMIFTAAQRPHKIGYDAVKHAYDHMVNGKELDRYYDTGIDIITKDNVADFLKKK